MSICSTRLDSLLGANDFVYSLAPITTDSILINCSLRSYYKGYNKAEAARNLGIDRSVLARWVNEFQDDESEAFRGNGKLTTEGEELRRLREENRRLRMEREILKKATAFFAKESS